MSLVCAVRNLCRAIIGKLTALLRLGYLYFVRAGLSQAKAATLSDISVLYKSENFVVINKRYDVKINSDNPNDTVTVEHQLRPLYPEHIDEHAGHSYRFIHRLDYATSGVMCLALSKNASRWGHKAFQKRYVTKHYLALVRGHVRAHDSPLNINVAIGKDLSETEVNKMCTPDNPHCDAPRDARTTLVLLEHGHYDHQPASKVLLLPHTGRTHQLRVHCNHVGHTVVGDYTYSNRKDVKPYRMMLHAYRLVIPMKHEHIDITAPDPFVTGVDPLWVPTRIFRTYKSYTEETVGHICKDHTEETVGEKRQRRPDFKKQKESNRLKKETHFQILKTESPVSNG